MVLGGEPIANSCMWVHVDRETWSLAGSGTHGVFPGSNCLGASIVQKDEAQTGSHEEWVANTENL